jgi:hypothetical protein
MPNILHLSDLHFGDKKEETDKSYRAGILELLVKTLANLPAG